MKHTLPLSLLALASLGLVIAPSATAQVPYISTSSVFGRDISTGFTADSYNAYSSGTGATNFNSNLPDATATGSGIFTHDLYGGTQITASASAIGGGFYVSKNYAKVSVANVQDSGYIAAGVYGTHTQLKFLTAPDNAAYSIFRWNVSGSTLTSPDTGYAGAVLRFMAGYYPTETYNSVFNTATPPAELMVFENTGNFVYNLPLTIGQNIDLFYQATASVKLSRDEAFDIFGEFYTAEADFASTTILDRIDLYDSSNNLITSSWSLEDASTGQALYNQNGRVNSSSSVPEPGTLIFLLVGGTLVLLRSSRRALKRLPLALLGTLVLTGCGGGGDEATGGGDPDETRKIVFQTGGSNGIGIVSPNGTGWQELTSTAGTSDDHLDPALSPDGTQITFIHKIGSNERLMLMNADGTNLRSLTTTRSYLRSPHWHPDGTRIVYGNAISGSSIRLATIKTDGTEETQLTAIGQASLPSWSPDGTTLAFVSSRGGDGEDIYTAHADGSALTRVTHTPDYDEWVPRWSPDGKKLISYGNYSTATDDHMFVVNVDGSRRTAIGPLEGARPCWSPSGKRIVFANREGTTWRLSTMLPDGTDIRNVTATARGEYAPHW